MKKIFIAFSLIFLFAAAGHAQKNMFGLAWEINFPNNSDYISKASYAGGKIDYRHFFKKNMSFGFAMNWSTYEEHLPRQTFQKPDGNSAVTSDFVAQAYQLPLTATFHYYFDGGKVFKPFVGIGLGGQYLDQSLYYNVYVSENNNWGFVARPELGTIIKPEKYGTWGFLVAASYSYATNKTELINSDSFKNVGISLGIVWGE